MKISNMEGGLAKRRPPQTGLVVTDVEATLGSGTSGAAGAVGVYVEDVSNIMVSIANSGGPNALAAARVQGNNFSPDNADARWVDIPGAALAGPLALAGVAVLTLQGKPYRWMRVRASCAAAETAAVDLAWTGQ